MLLGYNHKCSQNIPRVCWDNRVSNAKSKFKVLTGDDKFIGGKVNLHLYFIYAQPLPDSMSEFG